MLMFFVFVFWLSQTWPVTLGYRNRCFLDVGRLNYEVWSDQDILEITGWERETERQRETDRDRDRDREGYEFSEREREREMSSQKERESGRQGRDKYFQDQCLTNAQPAFLIKPPFWLSEMAKLWKVRKPDNFESHRSLKLIFTSIWGIYEEESNLNQTLLKFLL